MGICTLGLSEAAVEAALRFARCEELDRACIRGSGCAGHEHCRPRLYVAIVGSYAACVKVGWLPREGFGTDQSARHSAMVLLALFGCRGPLAAPHSSSNCTRAFPASLLSPQHALDLGLELEPAMAVVGKAVASIRGSSAVPAYMEQARQSMPGAAPEQVAAESRRLHLVAAGSKTLMQLSPVFYTGKVAHCNM